jgi:hypothetical protein
LLNNYSEIVCPSCKQKSALFHNFTQTFGCVNCGAVSAIKDGVATVQSLPTNSTHYSPKSFIKLGQWMKYKSKDYLVIGRTIWDSDYEEYFNEDGKQGYTNEKWTYHEWILTDNKGAILYLFEDNEGYHFSESIKPKYPNLANRNFQKSSSIFSGDSLKIEIDNFTLKSKETVTEIGNSTLKYIEGEIPWETKLFERVNFATYDYDGYRFTVETELNEKDATKASYFKEWKVGKKYLMDCFRANPEIAESLNKGEEAEKKYTFLAVTTGIFSILSFLLFFMADGNRGKLIKEQTFVIPAALDTTATNLKPENAGRITNLKLEEGPVKVILSASLKSNSDLWAGVEIHDDKDLPINAIDDQFYDEEGTEYWQEDGESGYEYFHEINSTKSELFQVEKSGTYSAGVYAAPQSLNETTVYLAVYQDVMSGEYFIWLGAIGLTITAILILIGYNSMPWRQFMPF